MEDRIKALEEQVFYLNEYITRVEQALQKHVMEIHPKDFTRMDMQKIVDVGMG
jgi:cellobiose-specific phosphotransferase system component IIB